MRFKNLHTGNYRHRVQIWRNTISRDAATNQALDVPALLHTRWGSIEAIIGDNSQVQGEQIIAECTHRIRLRYYEGLLVTDWLAYGSRRFDIKYISNVEERNWETVVYAVELVPTTP